MVSGIALATAGFLLAGPMPADAAYYPLLEGSSWTYHSGDGEEVTESVRATVAVVGGHAAAVATTQGTESYYVRTESGLVRFFSRPAGELGAEEQGTWMLRFPIRLGDQWESWTPAGRVRFQVTARGPVTTQARPFADAVRVDFIAVPEPLFAGHIWYAKDVGPVLVAEDGYEHSLTAYKGGDAGGTDLALVDAPGLVPPTVTIENSTTVRIALFALAALLFAGGVLLILPRMRRRIHVGTVQAPELNGHARYQWLARREGSVDDLEDARELLEEQVAEKPKYADLRAQLGEVYLELGRPEDAANQLAEAVELNPEYTKARILLATALLRLDHASDALKALQPAAKAHPEYADVRNLMGEIHRALGDLKRARVEFLASLDVNPDYERAAKNIAALDETS